MNLEDIQKNWDKFGQDDPLWAILTIPEMKGQNWDEGAFFQRGVEEINALLKQINALGVDLNYGRALDFGCGVGRLTQALAANFTKTHGVDIAPSMIEAARHFNKFGEKCSYYVNSRNDLSLFPDAHFDFIYSVIVLQHMHPRYSTRYILEFLRVLKPNGILVFQLPSELKQPPHVPLKKRSYLRPLRQIYQRLRLSRQPAPLPQSFEPQMEMHGIPKDEVVTLLTQNYAEIIDIVADGWGGPPWNSYTYFVTKSR